ncbi:DNA polymerase IV, partial [Pyronema omphalodes]
MPPSTRRKAQDPAETYAASKIGDIGTFKANKRQKLQNQNAELQEHGSDIPPIFKGYTITSLGRTNPDANKLREMVVLHGGTWKEEKDGGTIIVTTHVPPKKRDEWRNRKMVTPEWVLESINRGKVEDWTEYRVGGAGDSQATLSFGGSMGLKDMSSSRSKNETPYKSGFKNQPSSAQKQLDREYEDIEPPSAQKQPDNDHEEIEDEDIEDSSQVTPRPRQIQSTQPQIHSSNPRQSSTPPRRFDTHSSTPSKEPTPESPVVSYPEAAQVRMRNARTPEEFNQALLTITAARDRCCLNPNFLTHFFTSSRLHHLSTWKLSLRQSVAAALASHPSQRNLRPRKTRYIFHIDFDSFFCSVSLLSHPELKGKPVAVCHGSSKHSTTSEIASCNYIAREKGVKNGMWLEQARKLCPSLVTLPYDFEAYKEASRIFYEVVLGVGPERIQAVSVDEVLVDCSNLICDHYSDIAVREAKVMELAEKIRDEVRERTRCEVSVGVGTNVLLARVALRKAKPAGQAIVTEATSREVMGTLSIRDLPGIGKKIAEGFLQRWGSSTVADIRKLSREELQRQLGGKTGQKVYDMCRGIDTTEVGEAEVARESLSVAVNWGVRFYKKEQFVNFLGRLADYVEEKLRLEGLKGHKLTFSIAKRAEGQPFETTKFLGCGKCDMISKTEKFVESTNSAKAILKACLGIYNRLTIRVGDIRGLTIQMTELE